MHTPHSILPVTRRDFLRMSAQGAGLLAFSRFAPAFLVNSTLAAAPLPEKDRSILVLVQLAGGNDGLNTVIPYEDANYYRLRPKIGIKKEEVLPVSDLLGLHPSCALMQELSKSGSLSIIENVGYPNPNRSHFRSSEIWETGSGSDEFLGTGWIGRFLDNACAGAPVPGHEHDPFAVHLGNEVPQSFTSSEPHPTFGLSEAAARRRRSDDRLDLLNDLATHAHHDDESNGAFLAATLMDTLVTEKKVRRLLNDYRPETSYPSGSFAQSLRNIAALISANLPTRVYFVSLGGFDTHANQVNQHANLLKTLSEGLAAFQADLKSRKLDSQVLTMTFSEFGRRPAENQSGGTDHGTAAPLFVMGSGLKGPLFGQSPSLDLDRKQDLTFTTDFRSIYATVLDRWLECPSEKVLGTKHEHVPFIA